VVVELNLSRRVLQQVVALVRLCHYHQQPKCMVLALQFESRFYPHEKLFCAALEYIILLTEYRECWILKSHDLFLERHQVFHSLSSAWWMEPSFSQSQDAATLVGIASWLRDAIEKNRTPRF